MPTLNLETMRCELVGTARGRAGRTLAAPPVGSLQRRSMRNGARHHSAREETNKHG